MCGIAGFTGPTSGRGEGWLEKTAMAMASAIAHRGPDDHGVWVDRQSGVALSHRRLSILDLSSHGHQPMLSRCKRFVVVFNGEIYNFGCLRDELEQKGHRFAGHADTEVLLAAVTEWGLEGALSRFNGMFAFALYDREMRRLHLARDRLGEKPLYYAWIGPTFLFGSELKALRAHPEFRFSIDRGALASFIERNCISAPRSIYAGVRKLPPATMLTVDFARQDVPEPRPYWSLEKAAEGGLGDPFSGTAEEATDQLEMLLKDAVGLRTIADVPLGAFLSGGIDSSLIVALMQARSAQPVKTFTIGFSEVAFNEAGDARAVARHLGTAHTEVHLTPDEARAVIPRLPSIYDEPFADASQIPTFLVSQVARESVTVALTGDGADELFGGYTRHIWAARLDRLFRWMPQGARSGLASMLLSVRPQRWDAVLGQVNWLLPVGLRQRTPAHNVQKLAHVLKVQNGQELYRALAAYWPDPTSLVLHHDPPNADLGRRALLDAMPDATSRMMYLDAEGYLPDDILTKVDRASMAVSLEARVPMLDHRVVEYAWRLPLRWKVRQGRGKWILRRLLERYVPRTLIDRPKSGFGVPIGSWLRGPLRPWAEDLLSEAALRRQGYLDPAIVRRAWVEHLKGRQNWQYQLWIVLMFQAWLAEHAWS